MKLHKNLTQERWQKLSFDEQMGNVGAEIGRTINWRNKDKERSRACFARGLEILEATICDHKNKEKITELSRIKKELISYFDSNAGDSLTDEKWNNYFMNFALRTRARK